MRHVRLFALAAACVLSLGACATLGIPGSTVASDAKALSVAEASVQAAAVVADTAARSGLIKPGSPIATSVKGLLVDASAALDAAEAAYKLEAAGASSQHAVVAANLAKAASDVGQVQAASAPPKPS